jgi:predicted histone-like DNA-binding protein
MAIKFKVQEIGNPLDLSAPKKFYARPITSGEIDLEELSDDISNASSINLPDVYAVLQSLVRELPKNISAGKIVRLGNLGSFRLGYSSEGSESLEQVSARNIISRKLIFNPGKKIKQQLLTIQFEKE